MQRDAICAIATATGEGGISIVRCSGAGAREIFEGLFLPKRAQELRSHHMMYGRALDGGGQAIDEVMGVCFFAPNSYTREDMFEIQCHGGGVCARRVLSRVIEMGARIAGAGEFTKRAFLNGRIDLSRAEAVMSLIGAGSEAAARASMRQLEGGVSGFVRSCADRLKEEMALIEACTDFPEEVSETAAAARVLHRLGEIRKELAARIDERGARLLREGAGIVIAGRPNVGKSSLMNAMLHQERAIVTDIAGTTRDVLTERISIGGICAEISDTAGQRATDDPVEKIGVERAGRAMEGADVILLLIDGSEPLTQEDRGLIARADARTIVLINKSDLTRVCGDIRSLEGMRGIEVIEISARDGTGLDALTASLRVRIGDASALEEQMTTERHIALARRCMGALERAEQAILGDMPLDVTEIDLKDALEALGEITGENATEAVIDRVFRNFCVGK